MGGKAEPGRGKSIAVEHVELHRRFPNYLQTKLKRDRQHFFCFLSGITEGGQIKRKEEVFFSPQSMTVKPGRGEARPVSPHT